jgi:hypothetical protein
MPGMALGMPSTEAEGAMGIEFRGRPQFGSATSFEESSSHNTMELPGSFMHRLLGVKLVVGLLLFVGAAVESHGSEGSNVPLTMAGAVVRSQDGMRQPSTSV